MKKMSKTAKNIVREFLAEEATWTHYELLKLVKPFKCDDGEGFEGCYTHSNECDEVWKDGTEYDEAIMTGYDLYLVIGNELENKRVFVRVKDGQAFWLDQSKLFYGYENRFHALGVLDAEDIKVLVPLYNQLYLDRWAKNYMDEEVPDNQTGVHDEFTLLAQSIVNPVYSINVPAWRKVGAVKFRKIDEYDLDKRLVIAKTASDDKDIIAWA